MKLVSPGGRINGKPGGSKSVSISPSCELREVGGKWVVTPTPKFISDCKEQGRSEVTRQVSGMGYSEAGHPLRTGPLRTTEYTGYGISRALPCPKALQNPCPKALQNPCPKALAEPVQRVPWWETIDSTTSFFATVVALILIVLVAIVIRGVAW